MKAVQFSEYGDAGVLRVVDIAVPAVGSGQVLVRVAGAAFNPLDAGLRGGYVREAFPLELPHTPGYDLAGVVETIGADVDAVDVGDRVIAFLPMTGQGAAAEFALVSATDLVSAPEGVPLEDAASLPSVGTTAWQVLQAAGVSRGQRVLVNGAGGSVGGFVVQLARHLGAHVIAFTRAEAAEKVRGLGAAEVIGHGGTLDTGPVDVLVNLGSIAAEELVRLTALVRDGGVVVNTVPSVPTAGDERRGVRGVPFFVYPNATDLAEVSALVSSGSVVLDVAEHVSLEGLPAVHERSDAGALVGKVVVTPTR